MLLYIPVGRVRRGGCRVFQHARLEGNMEKVVVLGGGGSESEKRHTTGTRGREEGEGGGQQKKTKKRRVVRVNSFPFIPSCVIFSNATQCAHRLLPVCLLHAQAGTHKFTHTTHKFTHTVTHTFRQTRVRQGGCSQTLQLGSWRVGAKKDDQLTATHCNSLHHTATVWQL